MVLPFRLRRVVLFTGAADGADGKGEIPPAFAPGYDRSMGTDRAVSLVGDLVRSAHVYIHLPF